MAIYKCIASISDGNRIIEFVWSQEGYNAIYCYEGGIWYKVVHELQVVGGLGFTEDMYISAIDVVNGAVYWSQPNAQPRRVYIDAGIRLNHPNYTGGTWAYSLPIKQEDITIIRRPPNYPLSARKMQVLSIPGVPSYTINQTEKFAFTFAYFYTFKTGEVSTISMQSLLVPMNYKADNYNAVELTVPLTEKIGQDVKTISLLVMYRSEITTNGYIIKTFDKDNSGDLQLINRHNLGQVPLSYIFTNSYTGQAIDGPFLIKLFDSVPLRSNALKVAINRVFLGGNLMGYDKPLTTSLEAEVVTVDYTGDIDGEYRKLSIVMKTNRPGGNIPQAYYFNFLYFPTVIDGGHAAGYYDLTSNRLKMGDTPPTTININSYSFIGADMSTVIEYVYNNLFAAFGWSGWDLYFERIVNTQPIVTTGSSSPSNKVAIKTGSARVIGHVFYDQYMRQCSVVPSRSGLISIPERDYAFNGLSSSAIKWTLTQASIDDIPDWAHYYSIVASNDVTRSFFLESRASDIKYVTKDASGAYLFTSDAYQQDGAGIAVKLDLLIGSGLGYTFTSGSGDKIRIILYNGGVERSFVFSVIDQYADWVIAENFDLGNVSAESVFFEVFTPIRLAAGELFYEQGAIFPVVTPGTSTRAYSVTTGYIPGDIHILTRVDGINSYLTENMSPNDSAPNSWIRNNGRVQILSSAGQEHLQTGRRWSNVILEGTNGNGLSSFDALDQDILPMQMGEISKLMLAGKVNNEQGSVMITLCRYNVMSTYLGEVQLVGNDGDAFLASSASVIGTNRMLKKQRGTINPESAVNDDEGNIYFVDIINGALVRYSSAGLDDVSDNKMRRFWKLYSDDYKALPAAQRGKMPAGFDQYNKEYIVYTPAVRQVPVKGYLFDYDTGIKYPYDIYDGGGKCMVFKTVANLTQGAYTFHPESFVYANNTLYSFNAGRLYSHDDTTTACKFHGKQHSARLMIAENQQNVSTVKVGKGIVIEALKGADFTHIRTEKPWIQSSDIALDEWKRTEGVFYAPMRRDRLTPAVGATSNAGYLEAMVRGDKMRSDTFLIMLEYDCLVYASQNQVTQELPWIKFIDVSFAVSKGHNV